MRLDDFMPFANAGCTSNEQAIATTATCRVVDRWIADNPTLDVGIMAFYTETDGTPACGFKLISDSFPQSDWSLWEALEGRSFEDAEFGECNGLLGANFIAKNGKEAQALIAFARPDSDLSRCLEMEDFGALKPALRALFAEAKQRHNLQQLFREIRDEINTPNHVVHHEQQTQRIPQSTEYVSVSLEQDVAAAKLSAAELSRQKEAQRA